MQRKSDLFLKDILKEINNIHKFTKGLTFKEFKKDEKTIYAVTRSFIIMGEAVSNISEEIKIKYDYVNWLEIKDMRNIIVHKYWGVDIAIEWEIIESELKLLKKNLLKILKDRNKK